MRRRPSFPAGKAEGQAGIAEGRLVRGATRGLKQETRRKVSLIAVSP